MKEAPRSEPFLLNDLFDHPEFMGVHFPFPIKDPGMVQTVDAHMPVHMDDMVVGQDQPHMVDDPIGIVKKGQVPGFALLDETQGLSLFGLPKGCPLKGMAVDFVYHIYKAGTIDPEGAFASCQVGGHQILKGSVHQFVLWSDPLDSDPF